MDSAETLYLTYAHLRARYYNVGQLVGTGTQIGESGGKPGVDPGTGNSSGGHLHFLIDKNDRLTWRHKREEIGASENL